MKTRSLLLALTAALTFTFSGCFQVERVVRVNPDGSGTILENVSLGSAAIAQMKMMSGLGGAPGAGEKPPAFEILDEERLKEAAAKMGEGVKFVSAKKVAGKDREGYSATYSFTDITKLKLDTNPPDLSPKNTGGTGDIKITSNSESDPLVFAFTKGKPAELTVTLPPAKKEPPKSKEEQATEDAQAALQEGMLPMMQQMFKDMRVTMAIEVQGKIVKTNAAHQEGARVTLADIDFNKILADPAKLKAMTKIKDPNSAEGRAFLKSVPGLKMETAEPLKISFQ